MATHVYDKKVVLVYTTIVILWWLCVWALFEEFIHFIANKNTTNKIIIYVSIICIIIGLTYHSPETLEKF
jgi:Co/Zn/Cd efflux system component